MLIRTPIAVIHSHGPSIRQRLTLSSVVANPNRPKDTRTSPVGGSPSSIHAFSGVTPKATRRKSRDRRPTRIGKR
ncbi:MAG TPA: hypothetical protein VFP22_01300 [Candidatus Limnocylindrales bacterium]|nr:hypothetical protein [Candidatus Limnocylindrales bacterium]